MGRSRVRIKWVRKAHTYQPRSETTMPATPPPMPCPSPRPAAMLDSTTTPSACVVAPRSASTSSKSLTSSRAALSIRSANVLAIASSPTGGLTVRARARGRARTRVGRPASALPGSVCRFVEIQRCRSELPHELAHHVFLRDDAEWPPRVVDDRDRPDPLPHHQLGDVQERRADACTEDLRPFRHDLRHCHLTDARYLAVRVEEVDEPAEVPVGEDAFELAVGADDQEVTDIVLAHQGECRPDRGRGRHRFRVGNHDLRASYQLLHHGALPSSPRAAA